MPKEKQLIPQLRFPEFDGFWEKVRLGDFVSIKSGYSPSSYDLLKGGTFPFIKVEELNNCEKYQSKSRFYTDSSKGLVNSNSILFPKRGAAILNNKVRISSVPLLIDSNMMALECENSKLNFEFLFYKIIKEKLYRIADTSTIPQLNNKHIIPYKFYKTDLPEQQKIADFLSSIDTHIHTLEKKKAALELYKKGGTQKIFKQEIRFKDDDGKEFPEWEKRRFSDVLFEHKLKSTGKEEVHSVSVHKGVINQIEHLGRSFAAKDTSHYSRALPNDIIYTKSPTGDFPLGIIKQNYIEEDVILSPLYGVFTPETKGLGYMLHVYFESPINTSNYLSSIIQKGAKNTINITNKTFLSKKMLLPTSKEEQAKIADFLTAIDKQLVGITQQIEHTKTYKKGLLQQMFV